MLDGAFIHILASETVVLNTPTVNLSGLWVEGRLVFDHTVASNLVHLNSAYVLVTGMLEIGCTQPGGAIIRFTKDAGIKLIRPEIYGGDTGAGFTDGVTWPQILEDKFINQPPGLNAPDVKEACLDRGLVIAGPGQLFIYGADKGVAWTTLTATAGPPATSFAVDYAVDGMWKPLDTLILASSDFEYADTQRPGVGRAGGYHQDEMLSLSGFGGPSQINFSPALAELHFAGTETITFPGGVQDSITMKSELANLTRSVVIEGELSPFSSTRRTGTALTEHLGHVILMTTPAGKPYCEVEWAEFRNLGVEAKLARYPFHFHALGDARNTALEMPYLKHCSIHECVNRFAVVHDTHNVVLEGNVGYHTRSTGFFLEDTIERNPDGTPKYEQVWATQGVTLRDNLGLMVAAQTKSVDLPTEYSGDLDSRNVSVFWIGHPNQKIEGNHAAGAAANGFYLAPGKNFAWSHPANESSYFRNNVAHSNGQHGFYHQSRTPWAFAAGDEPAGEGLIAWKNRRYGIWWRTYGVSLLSGCKVADNKSGIYPASEGEQNAYGGSGIPATCSLTIRDSLIIGFSSNTGKVMNPAETYAGRSLPQTYFQFTRPDAGSEPNASAWDTINALEAYDGQNHFEGLRIAIFPKFAADVPDPEGGLTLAPLLTAGITQVEYNSKFAEDPRNAVRDDPLVLWKFFNVNDRILFRPATSVFSMIRNTVVYDEDGVLGHGANRYISYADPFFSANRAPGSQFDAPADTRTYVFQAADVDFAQIQVGVTAWALNPGTVEPSQLRVAIRSAAGIERTQTLGFMAPGDQWAFNASLGLYPDPTMTQQSGIYSGTFLTPQGTPDTPAAYEVKIQFCERVGAETILCLPIAAVTSVTVTGFGLAVSVLSLNDLLNTSAEHAYYFDSLNGAVYVKTTTALFWGGTEADEGTRNHIIIL